MCRSATMRRPLRSKRAMISPRQRAGEGVGLYEDQRASMGSLFVGVGRGQGPAGLEKNVRGRSGGRPGRRGRGRELGSTVASASMSSRPVSGSSVAALDSEANETSPTNAAGSGALTAARLAARARAGDTASTSSAVTSSSSSTPAPLRLWLPRHRHARRESRVALPGRGHVGLAVWADRPRTVERA